MLSAGIGILAALVFVLGLIALTVWALKRVGGGALSGRSRLQVEIVQRLPLGPKSGLAVVRVGEKVLAVSVGDGGVHTLFEVDEADRQRIVAGSELPMPMASSATAHAAFTKSLTNAFTAPLQRALVARRGSNTNATVVAPSFDHALLQATQRSAPQATPTTPASVFAPMTLAQEPATVAAPTRAPHRDLHSVLSMTLAPSTRLLSIAAFAVLAQLTLPVVSVAQAPPAAGGAPVATVQPPVIRPTPPAPNTPAAPTVGPVGTTRPAAGAARPATATNAAASTSGVPAANAATSNAARPSDATSAEPDPTQPASVADAVSGMVPQLDLRVGNGPDGGLRLNGTVGVVLMMGLMTLVPTLLLMMTGFTRILIVLHFLKQAMGTQSAPPAHLVAALALLLTGFVMAPTISEANRTAISPWLEGRMEQTEMLKTGVVPFREFMLRQTNEKDLRTFVEMSRIEQPETPDDVPLHVLMSAFVASELRTAFQIGFAIYLPFIIIDAVVASVLMAMGMFMLPPAMISLPFKLLLFVLVDGWSLTMQSLIQSFK
jgi:flagellar biosynthetic protein FliP